MDTAHLPPPKNCDACGSSDIHFIEVPHRTGTWPFIWSCKDCRASVGCHNNTRNPFGRMANRAKRQLRNDLHKVFDLLWMTEKGKAALTNRDEAYIWLAHELGLTREECHISLLTNSQLRRAIVLSQERYAILTRAYARRQAKDQKHYIETIHRERKKIGTRKNYKRSGNRDFGRSRRGN